MGEKLQVFDADDLKAFAQTLLETAGLSSDFSGTVAAVLVEGDLLGHDTHGLALLPAYLASIEAGGMALEGNIEILNERPAVALWDGKGLPGPWLVTRGFQCAVEKAAIYGTYTLSIRNSHHTAGLVSYLKPVVDKGFMAIMSVSDPTEGCVAPFGGCEPVLSTNPFAVGYPAEGGAVLLDMSTGQTTNGMVKRLYTEKRMFAHDWLITPTGEPSRDPSIRFNDPAGAIMPLGGFASGHKGTGLGMMVEALSHGLSGFGRHTAPQGWVNNVFLQVIDPSAFGGRETFMQEAGFLCDAIRNSRSAQSDGAAPRVAGQRAQQIREERLANGVPLSASVLSGLDQWAVKLGLSLPSPK
nr:Ldh family oxidoreductase [uncultured Cohaesibacter sp.]